VFVFLWPDGACHIPHPAGKPWLGRFSLDVVNEIISMDEGQIYL
jgi:hypothetical protein